MEHCQIFFMGAGRMATAIAGGMLSHGFQSNQFSAFDVSATAAAAFKEHTGLTVATDSPDSGLAKADLVILAVKPQYLAGALAGKKELLKNKLILSIVAGIKLEKLAELTGSRRIVRIMPNTPALVGAGVAGYAVSPDVTAGEETLVEEILSSIGIAAKFSEKLLNAVTGLSGSGPAYVFDFIQGLADGGVAAGLPRDAALRFAAATVAGSAKLVLESGQHPGVLRDQVTSPGGTTIMGVKVLENHGFRGIAMDAVLAGVRKAEELGNQ